MDEALSGLEVKVEKILSLCDSLRVENLRLRDRVGALEGEKQDMTQRMTEARQRLEGLMDRLPPDA